MDIIPLLEGKMDNMGFDVYESDLKYFKLRTFKDGEINFSWPFEVC